MTSIDSLTDPASSKTQSKSVAWTLRLEGAVVLGLMVWAFFTIGGNWWVFALLFFVPDFFMLGYLRDKHIGAAVYNFGHTYSSPAALALVGIALGASALLPIALIWAAHIGFDRLLGYGLKGNGGFKDTHLG